MIHRAPLSDSERVQLLELVRALGMSGAARQLGMSRTALASMLAGTARAGTIALYRTCAISSAPQTRTA